MKKIVTILIALLLMLSGCRAPEGETMAPGGTDAVPSGTTAAPATQPQEETEFAAAPEDPAHIPTQAPDAAALRFANQGRIRIAYTGNRSYVRYITSVEELPDEAELEGYDEAFFASQALVIVVETVSSGSVELEIADIRLEGDTASVSVRRTMAGEMGTADMATWLLWAEVDRDLTCSWTLENASGLPGLEKY